MPSLTDYIRIPNKSPAFDPQWVEHGHMEDAVQADGGWARGAAELAGATLEVVRLPGRTPLIFMEIPGDSDDTVLLYGHLDKQPEMRAGRRGWGRGSRCARTTSSTAAAVPTTATRSMPASLRDAGAARAEGAARPLRRHDRGVRGERQLRPAFYVDHLLDRIGKPSLVVCLDSGCGDYERLWLTTSLRGIAAGTLTVRVLTEGVHSGDACGIVPSTFRILRGLLSRLEDEATGEIKLPDLHVQIPPQRIEQAKEAASVLGDDVYGSFPLPGDAADGRRYRPAGAQPHLAAAARRDRHGRLSRAGRRRQRAAAVLDGQALAAPAADARRQERGAGAEAGAGGRSALRRGGGVRAGEGGQSGWNAPALAPWLEEAVARASQAAFGKPRGLHGRGRHDPLHGHAGREVPPCAVHDHRRARPAFQCARSQRVPARPHRQAPDHGGGAPDRRAPRRRHLI